MCIIAAIPAGQNVTKETLKKCWENNPHGGGFMYNDGRKVITFKEMFSFKRYWKAFTEAKQNNANSSFVCHFRISTHGKINETNCHPFLVTKNLGFAHNGIIYSAPISNDYSDTYMFNESVLKNLPHGFLNNPAIVNLIKGYIGTGNKLAFLNEQGHITIVNEKQGVWDSGVWYSNHGYKQTSYFDCGGTTKSSTGTVYSGSVYDNAGKKNYSGGYPSKSYELGSASELPFPQYKKYEYDSSKPVCDWCGENLVTSSERINGCCNHCFQDILESDRLASLERRATKLK